jgi:para-nitrobenzyl esterase
LTALERTIVINRRCGFLSCFVTLAVALSSVAARPSAGAQEPSTAVMVTGGQVRGTVIADRGAVFKGIPFAQPPVGLMRWREPSPVVPWNGVRDASSFGPPCAQSGLLQPATAKISSEDCLYLNVWTPEWPPRSRKVVMVWIPGGGNFGGTSNVPRFDGESLARQDVIIVTTNYRLSLLGFLAHPALTRESPHKASGNYGLLDQIAALRWVHDNIAQFGGDPAEVTIFGESAGSFDVSFLMTSPLARGLFKRAIAESGAVTTLGRARSLTEAERDGAQLMSRLNVSSAGDLGTLRKLPAPELFKIEPPYLTEPPASLLAVVDRYVLPKQPADAFASGQAHRTPLIIGNTARERVPGTTPPSDLAEAIKATYGSSAPRALALYATAGQQALAADPSYGTPAEQWATDSSFRCSSELQALWHSAAGNDTYRYEFDRVPKGREKVGATHASELPYVFGVLVPGAQLADAQYDRVDADVSLTVQRYWTNFAKTGDPNANGLARWAPYERTTRPYLAFTSAGPIARAGLRRQFCDVYIDHAGQQ